MWTSSIILFLILSTCFTIAERKYEVGVYPSNFCPKSKVCPYKSYISQSSFYQDMTVCDNTSDCKGYDICCRDSCSLLKYCTEPVQWLDDHVGNCPSRYRYCGRKPFALRPRCHQDTDCYLDAKCCFDPCLRSKVCFQASEEIKEANLKSRNGNIPTTTTTKKHHQSENDSFNYGATKLRYPYLYDFYHTVIYLGGFSSKRNYQHSYEKSRLVKNMKKRERYPPPTLSQRNKNNASCIKFSDCLLLLPTYVVLVILKMLSV